VELAAHALAPAGRKHVEAVEPFGTATRDAHERSATLGDEDGELRVRDRVPPALPHLVDRKREALGREDMRQGGDGSLPLDRGERLGLVGASLPDRQRAGLEAHVPRESRAVPYCPECAGREFDGG
jgi:hypothetical protein